MSKWDRESKKFKWVSGAHMVGGKTGAQSVGMALDAIRRRCGKLTPAAVLKEAKLVRSPLHVYFT